MHHSGEGYADTEGGCACVGLGGHMRNHTSLSILLLKKNIKSLKEKQKPKQNTGCNVSTNITKNSHKKMSLKA